MPYYKKKKIQYKYNNGKYINKTYRTKYRSQINKSLKKYPKRISGIIKGYTGIRRYKQAYINKPRKYLTKARKIQLARTKLKYAMQQWKIMKNARLLKAKSRLQNRYKSRLSKPLYLSNFKKSDPQKTKTFYNMLRSSHSKMSIRKHPQLGKYADFMYTPKIAWKTAYSRKQYIENPKYYKNR